MATIVTSSRQWVSGQIAAGKISATLNDANCMLHGVPGLDAACTYAGWGAAFVGNNLAGTNGLIQTSKHIGLGKGGSCALGGVTYAGTAVYNHPTADVTIIELNAPVPNVAAMPIFQKDDAKLGSAVGMPAIWAVVHSNRMQLESVGRTDYSDNYSPLAVYITPDSVPAWAIGTRIVGGDSGSPVVTIVNGRLALLGTATTTWSCGEADDYAADMQTLAAFTYATVDTSGFDDAIPVDPVGFSTAVSLTASAGGVPIGGSKTYTAMVLTGLGAVTGTIQFSVNGVNYGSPVAVDGSNSASKSIAFAELGNAIVVAAYSGDGDFAASSSSLASTVQSVGEITMYTEFYCDAVNGNNMNGGAPIDGSYPFVHTNGGWNSGTGVFTPASGNPSTEGSAVGDFAAVFADGSSTPAFVGRITALDSTTYTVSITAKIGTIPTTGASGLTIRVGGAWKGPNGANAWPVGSVANTLLNATANPVRVNMKGDPTDADQAYAISTGVTNSNTGVTFAGYLNTPGDGGRAVIDGGTNTIVLWTNSAQRAHYRNLIFAHNGSTGANALFSTNGIGTTVEGCIAHDSTGAGLSSNADTVFVECETYACNSSNTANGGGFVNLLNGATYIRCISHDNTGSNSCGFQNGSSRNFILMNCIADSNGQDGVGVSGSSAVTVINSDFYNNVNGINVSTSGASLLCQNSNFVLNSSVGVLGHSDGSNVEALFCCGFGTGTAANTLGDVSGSDIQQIASLDYVADVTPWVDPANGDFRINLTTAHMAGRGAFTQTQANYAGTIAYPDIGAAQAQAWMSNQLATADQVLNGVTNGPVEGTAPGPQSLFPVTSPVASPAAG